VQSREPGTFPAMQAVPPRILFARAISVVGPSVRMTRPKMPEIAPIVKNYALKISRAMVYKVDDKAKEVDRRKGESPF
jgi:hypothetical protein